MHYQLDLTAVTEDRDGEGQPHPRTAPPKRRRILPSAPVESPASWLPVAASGEGRTPGTVDRRRRLSQP